MQAQRARTTTSTTGTALATAGREWRSARLFAGCVATVILVTVAGCGGKEGVVSPIPAPENANELDEAEAPGAGYVAPALVRTTTYDGSGQLVHPDAMVFPRRWQGQRYWVSATPYPSGNPKLENPSIFHGQSSREMVVPPGVTNPVVPLPSSGYLSDPDILHDPDTNELLMYYRQTSGESDQILLTSSRDGVQWSAPRVVLTGYRYTLISPAVVRESATSWRMWTVYAALQGCYSLPEELYLEQHRSSDGITWGRGERFALTIPGRVPWHWDVQWIPAKSEYWALIAAYPQGTTCSQTSVYFARSTDGTSWKVSPTPLLGPGELEPLRDLVYRSTFHYHDGSDAVSVWFSGARLEGTSFAYHVASARYPYAELLRRVSGGAPLVLERDGSSATSAALRNARQEFERDFP